jgi:spore coat assembly protein SafA
LKVHTVQKGDTLWKISKANGISLESLIAANPQIANPDKIDVGMKVNIPGGTGEMEMVEQPLSEAAPDVVMTPPQTEEMAAPTTPAPAQQGTPVVQETPEPAYPSVPKWEGLWKYVVKNGDTLWKIAKQVGVTLEHMKAANPQISDFDKIYPGQVLNIPSSGMKPKKSGNPGLSPKEQLTAPIGMQPISKEQMLSPKEMATMEKPMMPPVTAPIQMAPAPAPAPMAPLLDIEGVNIELNPNITYSPQKEYAYNINANINSPYTGSVQGVEQQQQSAPQTGVIAPAAPPMPMVQQQQMMHHPWMLMYIPVTMKKKHKCRKSHKKWKKCGCHHHHHGHHYHDYHAHLLMMQQQQMMGAFPKTFYREED